MKRIYIVTIFVVLLLVSFFGITYSYEYNEGSYLRFELIGDYEVSLNVGEHYVENGVYVSDGINDLSNLVFIDKSMLNIHKAGRYKIKYELNLNGTKEYVYRIVSVKDNVKPKIFLLGDKTIYVKLGEDYVEPGYIATDNNKYDITSEVVVTTDINVNVVGEYEIKYNIVDGCGNENSVIRKIIVY